ncbi:transcriptional regulator [Streptacidiphilus sp. PB12-B1b]|uniref:LuxR C-terminal-related transcriptional regulator n=1 Tax=Streptacidiphilus sp. PB12-B1b TaxID=2705012 RepID=UPI0015F8B1F0|nr:LuxR C-terminal-related transcriptional regulator [Streptacidiphilus sp. PB12-B1b]QMU76513.1 transcriptional regulator [Streptacidiphilus sp. PB12-B1b]
MVNRTGPPPPGRRCLEPSGDPMLAARFAVPPLPRLRVHRPALLSRLTAGARGPLTLVNGPAGAGKTMLAAAWLAESPVPGPAVWLTVEPGDAPGAFWAYVLEAFDRHGVKLATAPGRPTRAAGVDRSFLVRIAEGLAESEQPVVLVLDQFDADCAREITDGLQFVLRNCAGGLRLVLTGRTDSLLPMHRYRAAGALAEIRNADLRFTVAETRLLLREHGLELSAEAVRVLADRTGGWAAGLRLCALAMQAGEDPEAFVREFAASRTTIADYLLTEVLDAQPPSTQELLLRASVTDPIHPDLADALTGRDDAAWTLARLARANAFLEQVDGSAWYRLHPLFAEVLHAHLRHRHPGLEPGLHRRAARWLAGTGRLTDAVAQAAAGGDWQFAAGLLVDRLAVDRLFTGLDCERLTRTFAAMPQGLPGAAPAVVAAACRLAGQDLDGCVGELRRADEYLDESAAPATRLSRALVGARAGRLSGDLAATGQAVADATRLLDDCPQLLPGRRPEIRALLLASQGAVELGAGRFDRAEARLSAAVEACDGPGTEQPLCEALGSLALVELVRGRLEQAAEHARGSLAVAERSALLPPRAAGIDHLVLAGVATEHDDLATARAELDLAAASAGPLPEPVAAAAAAVIRCRLATAAGDLEEALAEVRAPGAAAHARRLPRWAVDDLAIAESSAYLAHGDPGAALDLLEAAACDRPEHTVALARALLAAGHRRRAMDLLAELPADAPISTAGRVRACLVQAQGAAENGSAREARRFLRQALGQARPQELRRVFVESGPCVRRLLRQDPQLARAHPWLPSGGAGHPARPGRAALVAPVTEREVEVLCQAAQLLSTEEIAAALYLSVNTVKTHLKSVYRKLSVTRRGDAVRRARDLGLL